jgi:hypothetical protein
VGRRQPLHRLHRRDGVQPAPHAAAPDEHAVAVSDRRERGAQRARRDGWRRLRDPERDDRDQRPQRRVARVVVGADQAPQRHAAEPQVALALVGADDEVGGGAQRDRARDDPPVDLALRAWGPARHPGKHLDHDRVVEVGDEPRPAGEALQRDRRQLLRDHDVVLARGGDERLHVGHARGDVPEPRIGERARSGRRQRDVARPGQRARQLVGADRRAGHARADRLGGDDEHRRPHPRSASSVRRSIPPKAHSAAP